MLNGIDPIIIFEFSKLTELQKQKVSKIPIVSSIVNTIGLPPIPIYLSEKLTGLYIDTEDRNIDIDTTVDTLPNGADPLVNQKAINSVVRITMVASKDSIGLTLLAALCDLVVPKVSSKEYSITYLHGATTVFRGLLHSFAINQNSNDELYHITVEISKNSTTKKTTVPEVKPVGTAATLESGVSAPPPTAPIPSTPIQPPPAQPAATPPVDIGGLR